MRIETTNMIKPTTNTKNIFTRIKTYLQGKIKLKTLLKDVFEKSETETPIVNNESKKVLYPRKYPNSCSTPDEVFACGGGRGKAQFYPEDLEKMKDMTIEEKILYKESLVKKHRFYFE